MNLIPWHFKLASKSPRRHELFRLAGFSFDVVSIDVDESWPEHIPLTEVPVFLADKKSKAASIPIHDHEILITADTVVLLDNQILNKPSDASEARWMLQQLSGKTHHVITGVSMKSTHHAHQFSELTAVTFRPLPKEWMEDYIEGWKPFDKAGGYALQEMIGLRGIEKIDGCCFNVIGFPISRFSSVLLSWKGMF